MKPQILSVVLIVLGSASASVASAGVEISVNPFGWIAPPVVYAPYPFYAAPPVVYAGGGNWGGHRGGHARGHRGRR